MKKTLTSQTGIIILLISLLPAFVQGQKAGDERSFEIFEGVMIDMVWIPAGSFTMGNTSGIEDRWSEKEQAHTVKISEGFWMAKYETTQDLWELVMGHNPSRHCDSNHPVTNINWHETMAFIHTIQRFNSKFDLPTEAQWEHAAKAGTDKAYSLPRDEITWHKENSGVVSHPVGTKKPNRWGLYDIHGNVCEWTRDWLAPFSNEPTTDPKGPGNGERKLVKGGQFTGRPRHTMSFDRQSSLPDSENFYVGFRIMRKQ
ncbi:MAG: formylglycine-generating enzyme family protein [Roseivirga sp.]|nr:formylglycine-generating enzyme family protein [Roseivirga sp.]